MTTAPSPSIAVQFDAVRVTLPFVWLGDSHPYILIPINILFSAIQFITENNIGNDNQASAFRRPAKMVVEDWPGTSTESNMLTAKRIQIIWVIKSAFRVKSILMKRWAEHGNGLICSPRRERLSYDDGGEFRDLYKTDMGQMIEVVGLSGKETISNRVKSKLRRGLL